VAPNGWNAVLTVEIPELRQTALINARWPDGRAGSFACVTAWLGAMAGRWFVGLLRCCVLLGCPRSPGGLGPTQQPQIAIAICTGAAYYRPRFMIA
jgi:hypothetical protein